MDIKAKADKRLPLGTFVLNICQNISNCLYVCAFFFQFSLVYVIETLSCYSNQTEMHILTQSMNYKFPRPRMLQIKVEANWSSGFNLSLKGMS